MKHVHTVDSLAILPALGASQLNLHDREERQPRGLVPEPNQPRVEVDLGREGGDADQRRGADDHERGDGLVEEAGVDVGCLLLADVQKDRRMISLISASPRGL